MLHSKSNWNNYCLAYLLTDRDYSGVLGIAFNGQAGEESLLIYGQTETREDSQMCFLYTTPALQQYATILYIWPSNPPLTILASSNSPTIRQESFQAKLWDSDGQGIFSLPTENLCLVCVQLLIEEKDEIH